MRKLSDPKRSDFSPVELDLGKIRFIIGRHFGFCYGVENAIEISYNALEQNPGKRIFLLSQMIHNPLVNQDLENRGIRFIMDTDGTQFINWSELRSDDIVIIPAFGTTLETENKLRELGIQTERYNTTCPFVEKVWNRSEKLGAADYTVIIHGKHRHEETRATFSHSKKTAPSFIVRDINEAEIVGSYIKGKITAEELLQQFKGKYSEEFDPTEDFKKIGVVNQTTMLASETQAIADYLRLVMIEKYGEAEIKQHFADTRDTLCYATNDNQESTKALLETNADLAIVVGGYNSSNTSHLVELCEQKFPTYFVNSADAIISKDEIRHFDYPNKKHLVSHDYLPNKEPLNIILTSGASCPDTIVDQVMLKLFSFFSEGDLRELAEEAVTNLKAAQD